MWIILGGYWVFSYSEVRLVSCHDSCFQVTGIEFLCLIFQACMPPFLHPNVSIEFLVGVFPRFLVQTQFCWVFLTRTSVTSVTFAFLFWFPFFLAIWGSAGFTGKRRARNLHTYPAIIWMRYCSYWSPADYTWPYDSNSRNADEGSICTGMLSDVQICAGICNHRWTLWNIYKPCICQSRCTEKSDIGLQGTHSIETVQVPRCLF